MPVVLPGAPPCFVHITQQACEYHLRNALQYFGFTGRDRFYTQKRTSPLFNTSKVSKDARSVLLVLLPILQYSQGELLLDLWSFLKPLCHSYTTQ